MIAASRASAPTVDEMVALAIETGDEHAFKLTAACVAENKSAADEVFLASAADWSTRLLATRGWDRARLVAARLATR